MSRLKNCIIQNTGLLWINIIFKVEWKNKSAKWSAFTSLSSHKCRLHPFRHIFIQCLLIPAMHCKLLAPSIWIRCDAEPIHNICSADKELVLAVAIQKILVSIFCPIPYHIFCLEYQLLMGYNWKRLSKLIYNVEIHQPSSTIESDNTEQK